MISGEWLTVQDVAGLLQVRIETVRRWVRRGELPVLELGGPRTLYRIKREDLEQFVRERYRATGVSGDDTSVDPESRDIARTTVRQSSTDTFDDGTEGQNGADAGSTLADSMTNPRQFTDHMPAVMFREQTLVPGSISFMSSEVESMLGYAADEFSSDSGFWGRYVHPDDLQAVKEELARTDASGDPFNMEYRMIRRDGNVVWVRVEAVRVEDAEQGEPAWEGIIVNVTDRRRVEAVLRQRERQQSAIAELGQRALDGQSMSSLLDSAANWLTSALGADYSRIYEVLPGGGSIVLRAESKQPPTVRDCGSQEPETAAAPSEAGRADALSSYVNALREPIVSDDLLAETRFDGADVAAHLAARSGAGLPIPGRGKPFGVLSVYSSSPRQFNPEDVNFLQSIAHVIGSAATRMNDQWLTVLEVAEFLQVTEETVRRWIRRSELPALNLGGPRAGYRVYPSDLERFIQDRLIRV